MQIFAASYVLCVLAGLAVYWRIPRRRARNLLLCGAGLGLCASFELRFAVVLGVTSLLEYAIDLRLARAESARARQAWMWSAVALNVLGLAAFKYLDLLLPGLFHLGGGASLAGALNGAHLIVPLGLSFYSLQRLSQTLDIYWRSSEPCPSLIDYLAFVSFFPLLQAGPIERGRNLLPQLQSERTWDWANVERGMWLIGLGAFKKAFIGGHCALMAKALLPEKSGQASTLGTLFGIYAYAFELYANFAGYSDIARGTAALFGIRVMENFRAPYLSENVSEFWQRWHISLSSFLDHYVYRPTSMALRELGSTGITLAVFVTFLVSAVWHGRGATFLVWGAIHASALVVYTLSKKLRKRLKRALPEWLTKSVSVLLTFHVVCLGYVFFRAHNVHNAVVTLSKRLLTAPHLTSPHLLGRASAVIALAGLITALDLMAVRTKDETWIFARPFWARVLCYACMLVCVFKYYAPAEPFVYLQL